MIIWKIPSEIIRNSILELLPLYKKFWETLQRDITKVNDFVAICNKILDFRNTIDQNFTVLESISEDLPQVTNLKDFYHAYIIFQPIVFDSSLTKSKVN